MKASEPILISADLIKAAIPDIVCNTVNAILALGYNTIEIRGILINDEAADETLSGIPHQPT